MKKKYLEPTAELLVLVNKTAFICASTYTSNSTVDLDIDVVQDDDFWN